MTVVENPSRGADEADVAAALLASVELLPDAEQRLLTLLAVAVSATEHDLSQVHQLVWNEEVSADAVESFFSHPLVERIGERLRVVAPLAISLARRLHDVDPDRFSAAHSAFARVEQSHEDEDARDDELQAWATRSRIAYYLLRSAPDESASRLIDNFDASPASSRRACRLWLSTLTDRYTRVTDERTRAGDFFEAFRYYIAQDRQQAANMFERLIDADHADKIAAVSFHLLALCLDRKREETRRLALLDESIALSIRLKLPENLLMTRFDRVTRRPIFHSRESGVAVPTPIESSVSTEL